MKFHQSLLTKYLLIITAALILWPFVYPLYYVPSYFLNNKHQQKLIYMDTKKLEQIWHREALQLNGATINQINTKLQTLHKQYPEAMIFWVNSTGKTELTIPVQKNVPQQWSHQNSIKLMKESVGRGLYTNIDYIGNDPNQGFMVFQVPLPLTKPFSLSPVDNKFLMVYGLIIFMCFLFVSWLFFSKIRTRLVQLQTAMTETDETGIPDKIQVYRKDEIGQLGQAFNRMIDDITDSRKREREEEALRKQLIANISHDLRTPLTTIRGHAYSLKKESLSSKGKESLLLIENKVDVLSQLLENFLSYTLLSAKKYPIHRKQTDMLPLIRTSMASWYPVFEKEGFHVEVCLLEKPLFWNVDQQWFFRIMDNLFQNIVRHAKSGQYVGIRTEEKSGKDFIVIEDRGNGMKGNSHQKGAGIGLSIISLMLEEMNLDWNIISSSEGTKIFLCEKN